MFFKSHGTIPYNMFGNEFNMTDLTKVSLTLDRTISSLQSVNVEARTPEQMAADIYGDAKLFWVILYVNNIVDPFIDWYMLEDHLEEYCHRIYGDDILKVRYFIDTTNDEIITGSAAQQFYDMMENGVPLPEDIDFVTNFDYETLVNENKKVVKIIPKQFITKFVEDFKSSLKGKL